MPNPGGSTGHASNFIFPVDYSKMMTELTDDSSAQYKELGVFTESGGIEVARSEARRQELRRRASAAKAWGIPCELLSPAGVAKLVPYLEPGGDPRRASTSRPSASSTRCGRERSCASRPRRWAPWRCGPTPRSSGSTSPPTATRIQVRPHDRAATSRPTSAPSAAESGARASRGWPAPASRSRRSCTR